MDNHRRAHPTQRRTHQDGLGNASRESGDAVCDGDRAGRVRPARRDAVPQGHRPEARGYGQPIGTYIKEGSLDLEGRRSSSDMSWPLSTAFTSATRSRCTRPATSRRRRGSLPAAGTDRDRHLRIRDVEYDVGLIFTSLETAQELYGIDNAVHGIELLTDERLPVRRLWPRR